MPRPPSPSHRLDDRATQKLINHPLVRERIPSIASTAKKCTKTVKRCSGCAKRRRQAPRERTQTDLNAVREHIAGLSQADKTKLLKLINTKELVIPYVRTKDKRKVKLKIN